MLDLSSRLVVNQDMMGAPNLCDRFKPEELDTIGHDVLQGYILDRASRSKWEKRMNAAMDLAMQVQVAKTFPWPGCSNVIFPLVTIAALQFSARSYSNIIQGTNVVRYRVIGEGDQRAQERAKRLGRHMSWQVLEEDEAWEEEHDRLLINLAIVGTSYIKSYFDPGLGYPVDELVTARDLVMDYWAKSVDRCARVTQHCPLYPNEIYERCERGTFRDVRDEEWFSLPPPTNYDQITLQVDKREGVQDVQQDVKGAFRTLEQHCWYDFDKDGYAEPYIITVEASTGHTLRIVTRFDEHQVEHGISGKRILRINPDQFYTKYSLIPNPEGAALDLGFGVFLGPINEAVNSGINQILDSGTIQNSQGGLLGRGAKMRGGVYTMAPWEWKRVDSTGDDLRKNIYTWPERQPSQVMFSLLGLLIEYANRIAGTVDATVGENPGQNTPASTYQGMTEQGMQIYAMTFKRVYRAMKEEFKKRYKLNQKFIRDLERFGNSNDFIRREDYIGNPNQVAPVANPNVTSRIMRTQQTSSILQTAMAIPGFSVPEAVKRWLESIEVDDISSLYPGPDKVPPLPNWRLQIQQLKTQEQEMKTRNSQMEWSNRLMEEKRVNNAKITQLEAQAHKLMKEAGTVNLQAEIQAMTALINAHKQYGDMVNDRIEAFMNSGSGEKGEGDSSKDTSQQQGVPGMAGTPGDQSVPGAVPPPGPVGGNGAVGGR